MTRTEAPFITEIKNKLVIPEEEDKYILYRVEGENSIDGFHATTIYVCSNNAKEVQEPLTLAKLNNKLITVSLDIRLNKNTISYTDLIIAGYARSIHSFLIPQDFFLEGNKTGAILYFYKLELVSNYWRLTQDKNNCVYAAKNPEEGITIYEVLKQVLKDAHLTTQEYDLSKITEKPAKEVKHHCFVQYNESTHEFIKRLMLMGNVFAYDGIKDEKPCRFFVDNNQYITYEKYKQAIYHEYNYQLPTEVMEPFRTMDETKMDRSSNNYYGFIRYPQTHWVDKPYRLKQFGFYMRGIREEINVTKVNWHQYDPDDFSQKISGDVGESGKGLEAEYTVYSQGTTSSYCKDQSTGLLDRLKSNTFVHLYSTIPITFVGCMIETSPKTHYKGDLKILNNYVVYRTKYVIGYPSHTHILYANQEKYFPNKNRLLWDPDFYEFNFELTCLPKENYPPLMQDVSESPAVGKFLDALVVTKDGKKIAPANARVSTNEVGDVYVGLFAEYKAKKQGFRQFTPIRTKMNTTNGNVTPMINTPAAVMIHEFGGMFVYCGQRHDKTNKPMYKPETYDYFQRHDKEPPALKDRLCVLFDYTQDKNTLTTLSAYDVVVTAQNDITQTSEKDTKVIAKGTYTATVTKAMKITASDTYTMTATGAMNVKGEATYDLKATGPMTITAEATYDVKATGPVTFKGAAYSLQADTGYTFKGLVMQVGVPAVSFSGTIKVATMTKTAALDVG